jgi:hypothetical protein
MSDEENKVSEEELPDDLIPKPPSKLAPRGITSFTVYRQADETGVSGEGVVIEGVKMATGQCVVHWLYPPPRGGIAIFDSMSDFVKVHIEPHPVRRSSHIRMAPKRSSVKKKSLTNPKKNSII